MKNKIIRIGIPVIIVLMITGIFLVKNAGRKEDVNSNINDKTDEGGALSLPFEITKVNLDEMKSHGLPIILDFGSEGCQPCRVMKPALKAINKDMQNKAVVQYVDVWKYTKAADGFPINVIPTQAFYTADGLPFIPSEALGKSITFKIYNHKDTGEHLFTVHEGGLTYDQMIAILTEMGVEQ